MRAQLMLEMVFMLIVAASFVALVAAVFTGIGGNYVKATDSISTYYARSANALNSEISPYSEFHIIAANV
jgi:hypothetical protein